MLRERGHSLSSCKKERIEDSELISTAYFLSICYSISYSSNTTKPNSDATLRMHANLPVPGVTVQFSFGREAGAMKPAGRAVACQRRIALPFSSTAVDRARARIFCDLDRLFAMAAMDGECNKKSFPGGVL